MLFCGLIDRVVAELEPEIQRALLAGNIPSASIALIAGDRVVWTGAYGYSNVWARAPATPNTVYLIGSTFKAMSTIALLQEMASTGFEPQPDMEERLAIPYVVDAKTGAQTATIRLKASVWPAGIVYGTVGNQANWLIANLNGGVYKGKRLISERTMEQMFTRQYDQFKGTIEGIWETTPRGLD